MCSCSGVKEEEEQQEAAQRISQFKLDRDKVRPQLCQVAEQEEKRHYDRDPARLEEVVVICGRSYAEGYNILEVKVEDFIILKSMMRKQPNKYKSMCNDIML